MGLGPPVCLRCRCMMQPIEEAPWWRCPICLTTEPTGAMWEHKLADQDEFMENYKRATKANTPNIQRTDTEH